MRKATTPGHVRGTARTVPSTDFPDSRQAGPYLRHIKSLATDWPYFRSLADFMEVGTNPSRWRNYDGSDKDHVFTYPDDPDKRSKCPSDWSATLGRLSALALISDVRNFFRGAATETSRKGSRSTNHLRQRR
jgi:hypothetical protein